LPKGFVRIRHYGLLASVNVSTKLERCRQLLGQQAQPESPPPKNWMERILEWTGQDPMRCPHCQGRLQRRFASIRTTQTPMEAGLFLCPQGRTGQGHR